MIDLANVSTNVLIHLLQCDGCSLTTEERKAVYRALCDLIGEEEAVIYS